MKHHSLIVRLYRKTVLFITFSAALLLGCSGVGSSSSMADFPPIAPQPTPAALPRLSLDSFPDITITRVESKRPYIINYIVVTEHFRISYSLTGQNSVTNTDSDNNNIPDFVELVAKSLEYAWDTQVEYFRWNPPVTKGISGLDSLVKVVIEDVRGNFTGHVDFGLKTFRGDNPSTPEKELFAREGIIVIDNVLDLGNNLDLREKNYISSLVIHEFNHILQLGYNYSLTPYWIREATATWMEEETLNDFKGNVTRIKSLVSTTGHCQIDPKTTPDDDSNSRWYGNWIFMRYISERYGHETVRAIWNQAISNNSGYAAINSALLQSGSPFTEVNINFYISLLLRDFEEGYLYPTVSIAGVAHSGEIFSSEYGVGNMGAEYIEVVSEGIITTSSSHKFLKLFMVVINNYEASVFSVQSKKIVVDTDQFEHLYLLVYNPQLALDIASCQYADYDIAIEPGGEPQRPEYTQLVYYFKAPN